MRSGREATPTAQHDAKRAPSRRRFVQGAGLFALRWVENRGISMGVLHASTDTARWRLVAIPAKA